MRPESSRWSLGTLSLLLLLEGVRLAGASPTSRGGGTPCRQDTLAVYQVTFQTFWDQESFPRQYPEWRPPAQWSKLIGESVIFFAFPPLRHSLLLPVEAFFVSGGDYPFS